MTMAAYQCITSPLRLYHGPGCLAHLGRELDRIGSTRAVVVCGRTLSGDAALIGSIRDALGPRLAGIWTGVRAHSPIPSVQASAEELGRLQADSVIAVGGGSAIVTARAASILLAEGRPVEEMCTVPDGKGGLKSPRLMANKLPHFVVLTTPTTAGVKAGSAVFDPEKGERLALFDPKTRAQGIFIEPGMIQSAPHSLVVSAAVNALSTAIEGLMSRSGNPVSDAMLMHSVRMLASGLADASDEARTRGEIAVGALLCGQGTDHTGAGITTVLGHALGARFDRENGTINAIVLPHVLQFNAGHAAAGIGKVGAALGLAEEGEGLMPALTGRLGLLLSGLGMPRRLRDIGIPAEALDATAEAALKDWFLKGNPRPVTSAGQLLEILEAAW